MTNDQVHELFSAYSQYAAAYGADAVKYQRGIMAIQQMLGKGQVMSEELKQQLAEALPGAYEPFIKATQEAYGLAELSMDQFMDMMKKGQVKTKDMMKYVAKYMNEASAAGYERMQKSNVLAENRLKTFVELTRQKLFTRWADELTEFYYTLIRTGETFQFLWDASGDFVSGFVRGLNWVVGELNNTIVKIRLFFLEWGIKWGFITAKTKEYSEELHDTFSIAKWAGYAAAIMLVVHALTKGFVMASMLVKTFKFLSTLKGAAGAAGAGAITTGGSVGGAAGKGGGGFKTPGGKVGMFGKLGILGTILSAGTLFNDRFNPMSERNQQLDTIGDMIRKDIVSGGNGLANPLDTLPGGTLPLPGGPGFASQLRMMEILPLEISDGKITISIDEGEFSKIFDAKLEWENSKDINFMSTDLW